MCRRPARSRLQPPTFVPSHPSIYLSLYFPVTLLSFFFLKKKKRRYFLFCFDFDLIDRSLSLYQYPHTGKSLFHFQPKESLWLSISLSFSRLFSHRIIRFPQKVFQLLTNTPVFAGFLLRHTLSLYHRPRDFRIRPLPSGLNTTTSYCTTLPPPFLARFLFHLFDHNPFSHTISSICG